MKILYVVPYVPNPIRVRPYQLIRSLAARGHAVTVLTLWADDFDRKSIAALEQQSITVIAEQLTTARSLANCLLALPTRDPLQSFFCWHPALAKRLAAMAEQFDVVHIEHMRGARFGDHLIRKTGSRPPVIWDSVDSITHLFQQSAQHSKRLLSRWITRFELDRSGRYEGLMATRFDRVLVTSQMDRDALIRLRFVPEDGEPQIDVIPNGVDLAYFQPAPDSQPDPNHLVISGKMSYHANVTMVRYLVEQVLPKIWGQRPEVTLAVVGKDPPGSIRALAADPRITVTGYVEDLRPYLHGAAAAVAPVVYGAGIQNKVLEAMACGTPVITTARAVAALTVQPGRDLLLADTAQEFASAVLHVLSSADTRTALRKSARAYVEENHDWNKIAACLEAVYMEQMERKR